MKKKTCISLIWMGAFVCLAHGQQAVGVAPVATSAVAAAVVPAGAATPAQTAAPTPQPATLTGTVTDTDGAVIPGAAVLVQGPTPADHFTAKTDGNGYFQISGLQPVITYTVTVTEDGFSTWTSTEQFRPSDFVYMKGIQLKVAAVEQSVSAATSEQVATEQIHQEEQQRVLGIVPNFYVSYAPNPQPLTVRLKYQLALRASTDVVTLVAAAFIGGIDQAAETPSYLEGARGFGQRMGAAYAGAVSDVIIGGAVLPSLLHQDPRYFYKGTGTKKARALHAIEAPFLCKGDNGKTQFNISSIGGDLASGALANTYYPARDRGAHLVLDGALIATGGRMLNALAQEFLLSKVTTHHARP